MRRSASAGCGAPTRSAPQRLTSCSPRSRGHRGHQPAAPLRAAPGAPGVRGLGRLPRTRCRSTRPPRWAGRALEPGERRRGGCGQRRRTGAGSPDPRPNLPDLPPISGVYPGRFRRIPPKCPHRAPRWIATSRAALYRRRSPAPPRGASPEPPTAHAWPSACRRRAALRGRGRARSPDEGHGSGAGVRVPHAGPACARRLSVHENTVVKRLRSVEELLDGSRRRPTELLAALLIRLAERELAARGRY